MVVSADPAERLRLVVLIWSVKESVLKAIRHGLREDTRSVTVKQVERNGPGWAAVKASYAQGRMFYGWWREEGSLVRTMVVSPAAPPPVDLRCV